MANRTAKFKKEIAAYGKQELVAKVKDLESNLFQLRMQWKTGQLSTTSVLKLSRKELARVKTAITKIDNASAAKA